jgi:hypothetical protein
LLRRASQLQEEEEDNATTSQERRGCATPTMTKANAESIPYDIPFMK